MSRGEEIAAAFFIGVCLDMLFGDPQVRWHPVRGIGVCVTMAEKFWRKCLLKDWDGDFQAKKLKNVTCGETELRIGEPGEIECREREFREAGFEERKYNIRELLAGGLLAVSVLFISTMLPVLLLWGAYSIHAYAGVILEGFLMYTMFAAHSLKTESMKVYDALGESLAAGRAAVSMIVGRDTENLDETGIIKATVETIAENTSDGVIAPMLFAILGGAPLVFFYKAANTMDSMIGYKNEKYLYFGRAAAKLDDILNFIPARCSAVLMLFASCTPGFLTVNACRIFCRDRKKHASPNAAQTESVMAGALGVELAGNAYYFGKLVKKPTIGDELREIEREDIRRADRLMLLTALLGAAVLLAGRIFLSLS